MRPLSAGAGCASVSPLSGSGPASGRAASEVGSPEQIRSRRRPRWRAGTTQRKRTRRATAEGCAQKVKGSHVARPTRHDPHRSPSPWAAGPICATSPETMCATSDRSVAGVSRRRHRSPSWPPSIESFRGDQATASRRRPRCDHERTPPLAVSPRRPRPARRAASRSRWPRDPAARRESAACRKARQSGRRFLQSASASRAGHWRPGRARRRGSSP